MGTIKYIHLHIIATGDSQQLLSIYGVLVTLPWHEVIISHLTGKKLQGNTLTSSPSSSSTDSESLSDVTVSCLLLPGITSSNSETGQQKQKHIRCTQASVTSFINLTENHSAMCLLQYQLLDDYLFG
jgi:hypothetical protein